MPTPAELRARDAILAALGDDERERKVREMIAAACQGCGAQPNEVHAAGCRNAPAPEPAPQATVVHAATTRAGWPSGEPEPEDAVTEQTEPEDESEPEDEPESTHVSARDAIERIQKRRRR